MKESLQQFVEKKILDANGHTKFDKAQLKGKKLIEIKTFGKQIYIVLSKISTPSLAG